MSFRFHLVNEKLRVRSFDSIEGRLRHSSIEDVLNDEIAAHFDTIIFESEQAFENLNTAQMSALVGDFESGRIILGLDGSASQLREQFGLLNLDDPTPESPANSENWAILHRDDEGHLNELWLDAQISRRSLRSAFKQISEWYLDVSEEDPQTTTEPQNTMREPSSVEVVQWAQVHEYRVDFETKDPFHDNSHVGTGQYRFKIWALDHPVNGKNWYRIEATTRATIDSDAYLASGRNIGDTSGECGWWLGRLNVQLSFLTSGTLIDEYMPKTTVGSQTTGYSIGNNLGASISASPSVSAGASISVSKNYPKKDFEVEARVDTVRNTASWKAHLTGCTETSLFPFYHGASAVARTGADLQPQIIVSVPEGEPLIFVTRDVSKSKTDYENNYSSFTAYKASMQLVVSFFSFLVDSKIPGLYWHKHLGLNCNSQTCSPYSE